MSAPASISRRQFLLSSAAATVFGVPALQSCFSETRRLGYEQAVRSTWRHTEGLMMDPLSTRLELVRYATLAPSSHNTQCWKFHVEENAISILPDLSRRCPAVDPDEHHLFVSLGCASENLIQAAQANGLRADASFDASTGGMIQVALAPSRTFASPLFQAIPQRQCTRADYDGKSLKLDELKALEKAGTGKGVSVLLLTEKTMMEKILEYVVRGNTAQMHDPAFVEELKAWIRFNPEQAVRAGDGLFTGVSGNQSVSPWLGKLFFDLLFTPKSENDKYSRQVRSSAGIAVFVSDGNDKAHWVEAGRCYERFALQSTALGICNAFLNPPVEVSALRPQFASFLGLENHRPDLIVRFGRGPKLPRSLRRPVRSVLI